MKTHRGSLFAIAVFVGACVGAFLLVRYTPAAYRNAQAAHWPVVQGHVLTSRTVILDASLGRPGDHKEAMPEVRYGYEVAGRQYESDQVSLMPTVRLSPSLYRPTVEAKYPAGAAVDVRYDAVNPTSAVLEVPRPPYLPLGSGVVLVAAFASYQLWLRGGHRPALSIASPSPIGR